MESKLPLSLFNTDYNTTRAIVDIIALGFSSNALAVFAIYETLGDGLTDAEKLAMSIHIDAEEFNGNQALKDFEAIFGLSGDNGLVDYVGETVITAVNAPTHSVNGYAFDGVDQYLNTGFEPTADGVKFLKNDSSISMFIKTATQGDYAAAAFSTSGPGYCAMHNLAGSIIETLMHNSSAGATLSENWQNETLYTGTRSGANIQHMYKNGIQGTIDTAASVQMPTTGFYVGARNSDNSPVVGSYLTGTISSMTLSAAVGFSQSSYNTNLRALLTSLGTI